MEAVLVAFIAAAGAALAAYISTRGIRKDTKSPNGIPTGTMVYEAYKGVQDLRVQMSEQSASITRRFDEAADQVADHMAVDESRFTRLFEHVGLDES